MSVKKILIVGALAAGVAAVLALKQNRRPARQEAASAPVAAQAKALPRLVDLGAGKCIPCKAMKPILEELMASQAQVFATEFIDVWESPDAGKAYGISTIPTQIFYGADGKELYRHEGFYAKEEILAKWRELGVGGEKKE